MTDLNKLRSEFESNEYIKSIIQNFEWSEEFNNYQIKDCVINGNIFDLLEAKNDEQLLNGAWFGWQEKAKAQAVQQSFEIGRLQDRITELLDERQDLYAQINNDQAVPEGYCLVPKEIPDSVVSCLENSGFHWGDGTRDHYTPIYSLMVEVASESGAEG
ncbi:hypothetical protein [Acinetobacter baumannii]|uniref:hypothetical protein n=1 Tax=Acinetobacter baumannii TaxID=470 RepID=UPI000D6E10C9|nr:hypothetical protein [Acinetobacter baumannii]RKL54768.1 hypothetical protein CKN54_19110 [Acinetobacter baumannii]